MNGSLWTLPWELWMYCLLPVLFKLRAFAAVPFGILMALLTLVYALTPEAWGVYENTAHIAVRFVAFFYSGVALYVYRRYVPLTPRVLAAATAAFALAWWLAGEPVLLPQWLGYAVLYVSYHPRLVVKRWSEGADYSYGLYIFAYPVQQTLIWATGTKSPPLHIAASLSITLILAMLSWHFIEEPALGLKARFRARAAAGRDMAARSAVTHPRPAAPPPPPRRSGRR